MSILVYKNNTFNNHFSPYNSDVTLALSTSKMRYRGSFVKLVQCETKDSQILTTALDSFYAETIILDLFDTWVELMPEAIGRLLDDYDDGLFPDSQLVIVLDDEKLIDIWELENVIRKF
jgi:hypothetical protein